MKRITAIVLTLGIALSMLVMPVGAAEKLPVSEYNAQISAQAKVLEDKYNILITYPENSEGYASVSLNNLETLDSAFSNITPTVVQQVSSFYQKVNGKKLTIRYVFSDKGYDYAGGILLAAFEVNTSMIHVYLPPTAGRSIISGENPIALVHEFGHAFHLMAMDQYGPMKMRSEWAKFNRGIEYDSENGYENPNKKVFISGYAATSFEEDFAETFSNVLVRNRAGQGFKNDLVNDSKMTGLGQKVNYIAKLMPIYLKNTEQAIANYQRIYQTATSTSFEGIKFSGEHLQYMGYPQPKNILKGLLNGLELTSEKSTWVRELGAWRIQDDRGDEYFLFPGGTWCDAGATVAAA